MITEGGNKNQLPKEPDRIIIKVFLSTMETKEHVIELPDKKTEFKKFTDSLFEKFDTLLEKEPTGFWLTNPMVFYKTDYIVFIEIDLQGPEQWKEIVRKRGGMGFKLPKENR